MRGIPRVASTRERMGHDYGVFPILSRSPPDHRQEMEKAPLPVARGGASQNVGGLGNRNRSF